MVVFHSENVVTVNKLEDQEKIHGLEVCTTGIPVDTGIHNKLTIQDTERPWLTATSLAKKKHEKNSIVQNPKVEGSTKRRDRLKFDWGHGSPGLEGVP